MVSSMSTPIHKLSHDILYYIFLTNAPYVSAAEWRNSPYDSPTRGLVTTRRCSQVCQGWRRLILGSSSLWGRLLDVSLLQQSTHHWREEVLRRTGSSAPLWITYSAMATYRRQVSQSIQDFLFKVINEHWDRVEILDIMIDVENAIAWTTGSDLFTRPAPTLQEFSVALSPLRASNNLAPLPTFPFFSDNAPLIRKFDAWAYPLDLHHSWYRSLRSLSIFMPSDAVLFMEALASMRFLEQLRLRITYTFLNQPVPFESQSFLQYDTHVHLPRLTALTIKNHIRTCIFFMERITPAPGCVLNMDAAYASDDLPTLLPALRRELNRYLSSYYKHRSGEDDVHLSLKVLPPSVTMQLHVQPELGLPGCFIQLSGFDTRLMLSDILGALVPRTPELLPCLSRVKHLFICVLSKDLEDVPIDSIKDTISLCTSLEELQADMKTLTSLFEPLLSGKDNNETDNDPLLSLPLQTLSVHTPLVIAEDVREVIVPFLCARKHARRPISVLNSVYRIGRDCVAILINQPDAPLASRLTWTENGKKRELWLG